MAVSLPKPAKLSRQPNGDESIATGPLCPLRLLWAMRLGPTLDGARQMAAVIPLHQTSKWAMREHQPPVRQPNQASRTREYLTPDEVERMIVAARRAGGRLSERDALLIM